MSVSHDPVHVPITSKHDRKVFDDILSAMYNSGKEHITLINQLGIDLLSYKEKFDQLFNFINLFNYKSILRVFKEYFIRAFRR